MTTSAKRRLDTADLEARVREMYEQVALTPDHGFHFETGRALAERLGYPARDLDALPAQAIESFAGVGYFLDLADIQPGEGVLDFGSGSGTDSFLAAIASGLIAKLWKRPGDPPTLRPSMPNTVPGSWVAGSKGRRARQGPEEARLVYDLVIAHRARGHQAALQQPTSVDLGHGAGAVDCVPKERRAASACTAVATRTRRSWPSRQASVILAERSLIMC